MWLVNLSLRHPLGVVATILGIVMASLISLTRIPVDVFPNLQTTVVYILHAWPGMTAVQMEGFMAARFEYYALYYPGLRSVESVTTESTCIIKCTFNPGTDSAFAVAQATALAYRATYNMPRPRGTPGSLTPFVMRLDAGSLPVAKLVFEAASRTDTEIQDLVQYRVRPLLATLPGVSAPPPIGGAPRMVMITLDPHKLRSYGLSPDQVARHIANTNVTLPKGAVRIGDRQLIVDTNTVVVRPEELNALPLRIGSGPAMYLRDLGRAEDAGDVLTTTVLRDGRRAVYLPVTKRADASTLDVLRLLREKLPELRGALPPDIHVSVEFDQTRDVEASIHGLAHEALLGTVLTALAILLFLREVRSAVIVITSIPISIFTTIGVLWALGETLNVMTLGGLALAVGVLVDEATVEVENINRNLARGESPARAVLLAVRQTRLARLLAMLCVWTVFIPALFMEGAVRALFGSLALSVGLSMLASYVVSSSVIPVLSVYLLTRPARIGGAGPLRTAYGRLVRGAVRLRLPLVLLFLALCAATIAFGRRLPVELFPAAGNERLQLRVRAPGGTVVEDTEALVGRVLRVIDEELGEGVVKTSLATIGSTPPMYPQLAVYVWNSGPNEAVVSLELRLAEDRTSLEVRDALRRRLAASFPGVEFALAPEDVVTQALSSDAPYPIDLIVKGPRAWAATKAHAEKVLAAVAKIPELRDAAFLGGGDVPCLKIDVDRERSTQLGIFPGEVAHSIASAGFSTQLTRTNFWIDPNGNSYFVAARTRPGSLEELRNLPVMNSGGERPYLRDVAPVLTTSTTAPAYPHWQTSRCMRIVANSGTNDLAGLARKVEGAIAAVGTPSSPDIAIEVGGQIAKMRETLGALRDGLLLTIVVIALLLTAMFQSVRSALAVLLTMPATIAGVVAALALTGTSLNMQSFIGAIMALGVSVANAILLVDFFDGHRRRGVTGIEAAPVAALERLRPIVMTALAMLAGMLPLALGASAAGEQSAPLGRAVMGGLAASTLSTLVVLPAMLALLHGRSTAASVSLDASDPESPHYDPTAVDDEDAP